MRVIDVLFFSAAIVFVVWLSLALSKGVSESDIRKGLYDQCVNDNRKAYECYGLIYGSQRR